MWDFSRGPVRVKRKFGVFEERVRVLDFFEECLFRPGGVFSHGISIYFRLSDHSARNLSVDNFVPNGGFGEGDGRVTWCQDVHDCFGRFRDIRIFGVVAECDSEVILLCPSGQNRFDVIVLGTCDIDFVSDDVSGSLDPFPGSVSAESESVDLPVLESRSFGSGVDRGCGFGALMYRLVLCQNVWVVCGE